MSAYKGSFHLIEEDKNKEGGVWFTSFILQLLYEVKDFIKVDDKLIKESTKFLLKNASNGTISEPSKATRNLAIRVQKTYLTAFAAIALSEAWRETEPAPDVIKDIEVIFKYLETTNYTFDYDRSIASYAMSKHHKFVQFKTKSFGESAFQYNYLNESIKKDGKETLFNEVASYMALQSNINQEKAKETVEYLIKNYYNQYESMSTYDRYIVTKSIYENLSSIRIDNESQISLISESAINLTVGEKKYIEFKNDQHSNKFKFKASGKGIAFARIDYQYDTMMSENKNFTISTTFMEDIITIEIENKVLLNVLIPKVHVFLPTGYDFEENLNTTKVGDLTSKYLYNFCNL